MNGIEKMIKELCPEGVEWVKLGGIGSFFGGLSGKTKNDFVDGNCKFISYMNIFSNPSLNLNIEETVKIKEGENQTIVQHGDCLFTGSSETPEGSRESETPRRTSPNH